jgi:hypothetical protein
LKDDAGNPLHIGKLEDQTKHGKKPDSFRAHVFPRDAGEGGWLTAHQPTKHQAMLSSLSTHLLAPRVQKKSLPGAGGVFLTRGDCEGEALAQGEAMVHQEGEAVRQEVMLQPPGANESVLILVFCTSDGG